MTTSRGITVLGLLLATALAVLLSPRAFGENVPRDSPPSVAADAGASARVLPPEVLSAHNSLMDACVKSGNPIPTEDAATGSSEETSDAVWQRFPRWV